MRFLAGQLSPGTSAQRSSAFANRLPLPLYNGVAHLATRAPPPLLYSDKDDADPSKCPFFGGPNGGGLGDLNIVTGAAFILTVFALNRLVVGAIAIGPRRLATGFAAAVCHAAYSLRRLATWLLAASSLLGTGRAAPPPPTFSVAVVVSPGFYLLDAMGPLDVFRAAQLKAYAGVNLTSHEWHPNVPGGIIAHGEVRVDLLGPSKAPMNASDGAVVTPDAAIAHPPRASYDLIVVPAGADSPEIRAMVSKHYARGGALMSVCTGAGLLADLGLLDGKEATTNSLLLWRMRRDYPAVRWTSLRDRTDRRFIVSEPPLRIVTTAGVTAGVDGALHYLDSWLGKPVAEAVREFVEWPLGLEELRRSSA